MPRLASTEGAAPKSDRVAPSKGEVIAMLHYHIRWTGGKLDWEAFHTQDEARIAAKELVRSGESYTIEQLDGACPHCTPLQLTRLSQDAESGK